MGISHSKCEASGAIIGDYDPIMAPRIKKYYCFVKAALELYYKLALTSV